MFFSVLMPTCINIYIESISVVFSRLTYPFFCLQVKFLKKIKHEHEGVPCLLFGHSTGGAIVLKVKC